MEPLEGYVLSTKVFEYRMRTSVTKLKTHKRVDSEGTESYPLHCSGQPLLATITSSPNSQ